MKKKYVLLILVIISITTQGCAKSKNVLAPNEKTGAFSTSALTSLVLSPGSTICSGDINGDGKTDIVAVGAPGQSNAGCIYTALSNGSGFPGWTWNSSVRMLLDNDRFALGDVNGDGKADLVAIQRTTGYVYIALSNGIGFQNWSWNSTSRLVLDSDRFNICDINGDRKADLIFATADVNGYIKIILSDGVGYNTYSHSYPYPSVPSQYLFSVGDINGDGKSDLVRVLSTNSNYEPKGYTESALSTGIRFSPFGTGTILFTNNDKKFLLTDVNGDGKAELVGIQAYTGAVFVSYYIKNANSNEFGFWNWSWSSGHRMLNDNDTIIIAGDVNGDHLSDLIAVQADSGRVFIAYSNGSGFNNF